MRRRGFTLMELLVALMVTAFMGVCVAMIVGSVSAGTAGQQDGRRHLVRAQALQARIVTSLHSAQSILAAGDGYLVYWIGDLNNDNALQLNELAMFELDTATHQLKEYHTVFPSYFTVAQKNAANSTYAATSNWLTSAQAAKAQYFTASAIAGHVTSFRVTLDHASPTAARLATCTLTLNDGQVQRNVTIIAGIRSQAAPR